MRRVRRRADAPERHPEVRIRLERRANDPRVARRAAPRPLAEHFDPHPQRLGMLRRVPLLLLDRPFEGDPKRRLEPRQRCRALGAQVHLDCRARRHGRDDDACARVQVLPVAHDADVERCLWLRRHPHRGKPCDEPTGRVKRARRAEPSPRMAAARSERDPVALDRGPARHELLRVRPVEHDEARHPLAKRGALQQVPHTAQVAERLLADAPDKEHVVARPDTCMIKRLDHREHRRNAPGVVRDARRPE